MGFDADSGSRLPGRPTAALSMHVSMHHQHVPSLVQRACYSGFSQDAAIGFGDKRVPCEMCVTRRNGGSINLLADLCNGAAFRLVQRLHSPIITSYSTQLHCESVTSATNLPSAMDFFSHCRVVSLDSAPHEDSGLPSCSSDHRRRSV